MACTECHSAKVKCDKDLPCARCVRLSKVCVLHTSRQGQPNGPNRSSRKRSRRQSEEFVTVEEGVSEDATLTTQVNSLSLRSDHFGLQYLIRSWTSTAIRRRSFGLLARAASMAVRCSISMDQMLCDQEVLADDKSSPHTTLSSNQQQRGMDFLYPILLLPAAQQQVTGTPLRYAEIPARLLTALDCPLSTNASSAATAAATATAATATAAATTLAQEEAIRHRWIWVREMKKGISRFFVSAAFSRDVASVDKIHHTMQRNQHAVVDLFLQESERPKHTRGVAFQISNHSVAHAAPVCSRTSVHLKIKSAAHGIQLVAVDQVMSMELIDLDYGILAVEYVRRQASVPAAAVVDNDSSNGKISAIAVPSELAAADAASTAEKESLPGFDMELPFFDLDDLTGDANLEFFLSLLQ